VDFQRLVTTEFGTRTWLALGAVPPRMGYAIARWLTRRLHRHKSGSLYKVLYANQKHVMGEEATDEQVDDAVAAVLRHAGISQYDIVRAISQGEQAIIDAFELGEPFWTNLNAARATGRGVLIFSAHLTNFNLGFLAFAIQGGFPIQTLSAPMPAGGFGVIRDLRNRGAIEDTAIDAASLLKAVRRLRGGGAAAIGIDWPIPESEERIEFFGAPSFVSSGPVRLALSANALVVPLHCMWSAERGYWAVTDPPIELTRSGNRERDIQDNTRHLLSIVEGWIRAAPDQWLMYHPVWPEPAGA